MSSKKSNGYDIIENILLVNQNFPKHGNSICKLDKSGKMSKLANKNNCGEVLEICFMDLYNL